MNKFLLCSILFILLLQAATPVQGQEIKKWKLSDLETAIRTADKPTIFNFWATFCKPCIAEIPYFQQLVKKYDSAGVRLVLISLDSKDAYPKAIATMAVKRKFTAPIAFLDETNADLFCPVVDPSWSGVIPATLLVNNQTGYRKFFEESLKKDQLDREIKAMLGHNY